MSQRAHTIEVDEADFEDGWYRAMFAEADLLVRRPGGKTDRYHPPYPHSDAEQAMFDRYPGMAVCIGATHALEYAQLLQGRTPDRKPESVVARESWQVRSYWIEGERDVAPRPNWDYCREMIAKYVPEGLKPPPPPRYDIWGPG